jgi:four helix bundle protein
MKTSKSDNSIDGGYKNLRVWQASMDLVVLVYEMMSKMPRDHGYALIDQLNRAVISIPSNLAEGHATGTNGLYRRHVRTACGSAAEVETQLLIAYRVGIASQEQIAPLLTQASSIRRQLFALRNHLDAKISST